MTPSIIRRFARYHGQYVAGHDARKTALELVTEVQSAIGYESGEAGRSMLVRDLTRIEVAEMRLESADVHRSLADEGTSESTWYDFVVIAERDHARRLLRKAGIDPDKWREVKDEET